MPDHLFQVLFHILTNEQELLKRTDQKASTLMSTLAVFMVFFIVHYKNIPINNIAMVLIVMFFASALITILSLLRVLSPRLKNTQIQMDSSIDTPNPTYFAGIAKFKDQDAYRDYLTKMVASSEKTYEVFANNVFSIGQINAQKYKFFTLGMKAFTSAVFFELVIIMSMYVSTYQVGAPTP